jgi:hypothetical protein
LKIPGELNKKPSEELSEKHQKTGRLARFLSPAEAGSYNIYATAVAGLA